VRGEAHAQRGVRWFYDNHALIESRLRTRALLTGDGGKAMFKLSKEIKLDIEAIEATRLLTSLRLTLQTRTI